MIEGCLAVDFLRAMSVVATQEVERETSLLAVGTAALYNLWWLGDEGMQGLTNTFPSTWSGPASMAAAGSLDTVKQVAHQVGKIAADLRLVPAKYAAVHSGRGAHRGETDDGPVERRGLQAAEPPQEQRAGHRTPGETWCVMKPKNGGLIAIVVATLMLAACTPTEPDDQATNTPGRTSSTTRPIAKNRDEQAVVAALLRIDPCALLKSAAIALPGYYQRVQLKPDGPTRCTVSSADHAGVVGVWLDELSTNQRLQMSMTSLGGAKAYVQRTAVCKIYLPVSFTYALAFLVDGFPGEDQCPTGEQFVEAAAVTLARPETVRAEPRWDTCDLLRGAIGDENGNYRRTSQVTILDDCDEERTGAWLYFDYGIPGVDTDHVKYTKDVVGNTTVWRYELADGCRVEWRAGPPRHQSEVGLRALVRLPTCEGAKRLAGSVMALLAQRPPNDVAPQQPLLYKPDEPDMPE